MTPIMNTENPMPDTSAAGQSLGSRLKHAREAQGLSVEDVAARLKLLQRVILAIERDDWERLGSGVHLRGQMGSYARLVGVPHAEVDDAILAQPSAAPPLITMSHTSRLRTTLDRSARKVVYLAITAAIALPVWLATREHLSQGDLAITPLDEVSSSVSAPGAGDPPGAASRPGTPIAPIEEPPVVASLTPRFDRHAAAPKTDAPVQAVDASAPAETPASADAPGLVLRMREDSWVEIFAPDGRRLEHGIVPANSERRFAPGAVGRVTVGNAGAVEVLNAGEAVDLAPYRRQDIARFRISSDGKLTPADG